jgi:hypothetical protein
MDPVTDLLKIRNVERVLDGLSKLAPEQHFGDVTRELDQLLWEIPENETSLEILADLHLDYWCCYSKYQEKLAWQATKKQAA